MAKHKYYSKKENFISGSEQLLGKISAQSEGSILAPKGSCAAQEDQTVMLTWALPLSTFLLHFSHFSLHFVSSTFSPGSFHSQNEKTKLKQHSFLVDLSSQTLRLLTSF